MFPGLGKRGAGEQWTDEREETNRQKPRGGLPSTSGRKEVGKNRLADCKDISVVSQSRQSRSLCRAVTQQNTKH